MLEAMVEDPNTAVARWKSDQARARFEDLYAALTRDVWQDLEDRGLQPRPERVDVDTAFGTTAAWHWPGAGEPIVLIHGQNATSLMWAPLLAELAGRDLYALDIVGEAGASVQTRPITGITELVAWLQESQQGLRLARPHLVGASFGAWPATHYAAAHPDTVHSLSLLEPAIDAVTMGRFLRHGMAVGAALLLPRPLRRSVGRRLDADTLLATDPRLIKLGNLTFRHFERGLPKYAQVKDATPDTTLAALEVPTLLVLAGKSELHDTARVADRARRLINQAEVQVIANASHAMPVTQATTVGAFLRAFLDGPATSTIDPNTTAAP